MYCYDCVADRLVGGIIDAATSFTLDIYIDQHGSQCYLAVALVAENEHT